MAVILVVDDSAMDRRLAEGLLRKDAALTVVQAANGKEALEQLALAPIDLIVTDLLMPEMNGLELVSAVRSDYPLVPVILMTGKGSEETAVEALQQGAAGYVTKKLLAQNLLDTVHQVLEAAHEDRSQARLMHRVQHTETSFVLENDLTLIRSLIAYLQQMIRCMCLADETDRLRVRIALEEALLNAFYHGNLEISSELRERDHDAFHDLARQRCQEQPYCDRRIHVHVRLSRSEAMYEIRDEGPGFDPSCLPDPTDPENLSRPCGRGVLLMRTFMDKVIYNATGNVVTLVKHRAPEYSEAVESVP